MSKKGTKYKSYGEFKMARVRNLENKSSAQSNLVKETAGEPPLKRPCYSDTSVVKELDMPGNVISKKYDSQLTDIVISYEKAARYSCKS